LVSRHEKTHLQKTTHQRRFSVYQDVENRHAQATGSMAVPFSTDGEGKGCPINIFNNFQTIMMI